MRSFHLPVLFLLRLRLIRAACYNPDGSEVTNDAFQPCSRVVGTTSMCCGTNWTDGTAKDVCRPNGLCLNSYNGGPLYWRGSCTDPSWKSPDCLANLCTDYSSNGNPTGNVALTDCGDGTWCCQGGNATCCARKEGVFLAATLGVSGTGSTSPTSTPPGSASASVSGSPFSAASPTADLPALSTATTTIPAEPPGGLSNAAKVSIGVGVSVGVLAIASVVIISWWLLRYRHHHAEYAADLASPYANGRAGFVAAPSTSELPMGMYPPPAVLRRRMSSEAPVSAVWR